MRRPSQVADPSPKASEIFDLFESLPFDSLTWKWKTTRVHKRKRDFQNVLPLSKSFRESPFFFLVVASSANALAPQGKTKFWFDSHLRCLSFCSNLKHHLDPKHQLKPQVYLAWGILEVLQGKLDPKRFWPGHLGETFFRLFFPPPSACGC